jgi:hypothetical protein|tara:strand:- start:848 stop:994 length:147 start_codon:yes stop_codon:yes gene_type:complete
MNIFKESDAAPFEKLMKQVIAILSVTNRHPINVVCFIACAVVIYMECV